jgi:putative transcriptional regulator
VDATLRNSLKVERARRNLTQEQLAALAGVTRKTINTIGTGRFVPSTTLALKLAQVLECHVEDLFELDESDRTGIPEHSTMLPGRPAAVWRRGLPRTT